VDVLSTVMPTITRVLTGAVMAKCSPPDARDEANKSILNYKRLSSLHC